MNPNFSVPSVQLPVMLVAEVQDSLLVAMHDLHRLEGLIAPATDNLMTGSPPPMWAWRAMSTRSPRSLWRSAMPCMAP